MRYLTGLTSIIFLLAAIPAALANTTIIHAGELLAVPDKAAKPGQTIIIEDDRIVEIRKWLFRPR